MKVNISKYHKNGKPRKEEVRIDPWDTWSMDHTLSLIILPMLKQLRENNHVAPYTDDEDVPENLRSTNTKPKKNEWDTDEFHFDRWNYVMDEMIWAFEQIASDGEDEQKFFGQEPPDYKIKFYDKEGHQKHCYRIQNGTKLFGKYFQSLWD